MATDCLLAFPYSLLKFDDIAVQFLFLKCFMLKLILEMLGHLLFFNYNSLQILQHFVQIGNLSRILIVQIADPLSVFQLKHLPHLVTVVHLQLYRNLYDMHLWRILFFWLLRTFQQSQRIVYLLIRAILDHLRLLFSEYFISLNLCVTDRPGWLQLIRYLHHYLTAGRVRFRINLNLIQVFVYRNHHHLLPQLLCLCPLPIFQRKMNSWRAYLFIDRLTAHYFFIQRSARPLLVDQVHLDWNFNNNGRLLHLQRNLQNLHRACHIDRYFVYQRLDLHLNRNLDHLACL